MHTWRPRQKIRILAIGLAWRVGKLLAAEVYDDAGHLKGVRPLGGGVEFGERWQDALRREFQEELSLAVEITGPPYVLENIYTHHGQTGHEIVFAANVALPTGALDGQEVIHFREDGGQDCVARWFDLGALTTRGVALFPAGLATALAPGEPD